jgi:hypothetical protein
MHPVVGLEDSGAGGGSTSGGASILINEEERFLQKDFVC